MVIDEKKIPENQNLFFLGNTPRPILVISEKLKEAMEEKGLTGFKFIPSNEFTI